MPKFSIRRAVARDAQDVADCIDAAYSIYADRIDDLPAVSEAVAEAIEHKRVWVAETQRVAGALILVPSENYLVLENVAVRPDCTGSGLGRALIEQAEKDCRELSLREIRLSTHADMPENVAIYTRLGWSETGRAGNKVHMSKAI